MNTAVTTEADIAAGNFQQPLHPTDLQRLRQALLQASRRHDALPLPLKLALIVFAALFAWLYPTDMVVKIALTIIILLVGWLFWRDFYQRRCRRTAIGSLSDQILERAWAYALNQYYFALLRSVIGGNQDADTAIACWSQIPPSLRSAANGDIQHFRDAEQSRFRQPREPADGMAFILGMALTDTLSTEALLVGLTDTENAWVKMILPDLSGYIRAGCPNF